MATETRRLSQYSSNPFHYPEHMSQALLSIATHQFNDETLRRSVPFEVYIRFKSSIDEGTPLSKEDKDVIAEAMGKWAMECGAAQYAHMFYPVRSAGIGVLGGSSGLKHDAFINLDFKSKDLVKPFGESFSGTQLFVGETDGSSFPNGGLRSTHEAGAWTAWDRTSPPSIIDDTLYIPCTLISQNGKALDEKIPLLRSNDAVNVEGLRLLKLIGDNESKKVVTNVGPEQEFFIIDRDMYLKRPDLMACGRTVLGASPPKGQEECLNYFSQIQPRIKAFFIELHERCWKLGISNAVMHNEVAPAQCEVSHIFTLTNVAADWNILMMDVMSHVAIKHGLVVLLHEKPFAHINGNGKHNNWGLFTDKGDVLFTAGKNAREQERFMTFVSCLTHAIHLHGDVLRAGVASAGNDHRLGAQEAPPALLSIYVGQSMEDHVDSIIKGGPLAGYEMKTKTIDIGCSHVSPIEGRLEDRNRTAPMPFCGNRFEFRAVGSAQNIAWPLTCLNTTMAESMSILSKKLESGVSQRDAVAQMFKESRRVLFAGDCYSDEWKHEAIKVRKLPDLPNTFVATKHLVSPKNIKLFSSMKVFGEDELCARQQIMYEAYANIITIEANVMIRMLETGVIPAMAQDLNIYGTNVHMLAGERVELYQKVATKTKMLKAIMKKLDDISEAEKQAEYCNKDVIPMMNQLRAAHDDAEAVIRKDLYPFPSYADILFHHHASEPLPR